MSDSVANDDLVLQSGAIDLDDTTPSKAADILGDGSATSVNGAAVQQRAPPPPPMLHPKFQTYGIGKLLITTSYGSLYPPVDTVAVSLCLFYMGKEYNIGLDVTQWILLTYLITSSVAGACVGKFAERIGVDMMFKMAYIGLTVCNILIAIIPSPYAAMILRAFGGVFNSCGVATHAYLQRFLGKPSIITKLMSIQSTTLSLFNIAYPIIVGLINDSGTKGWHFVFVMNAILALQCVISSFILIPRLPRSKNVKFDPLGMLLLLITVASLNVGLGSVTLGWKWYLTIAFLVVFAVFLGLFIVCEKKVSAPMIPFDFLKDRDTVLFFLIIVISIGVFTSKTMICPYVFPTSFGFTSLKSSLTLGVLNLTMGITSLTLSKLFGKFVSRFMFVAALWLTGLGCILEGLGYMLLSVPIVILSMAVMGVGTGIFYVCMMTGIFRFGARNITLFAGLNNSFQNVGKSIITSLSSMLLSLFVEMALKANDYNEETDIDGKLYARCYAKGAATLTFIIASLAFVAGVISLFIRISDSERGRIGFKESKLDQNRTQQTIMTDIAAAPALGGAGGGGGNGLIESMVEVSDDFSDEFISDF